jgi:hypothetical protein
MAKLSLHTIEKPCSTRTGGVFSKTQKKMIQAGFGAWLESAWTFMAQLMASKQAKGAKNWETGMRRSLVEATAA